MGTVDFHTCGFAPIQPSIVVLICSIYKIEYLPRADIRLRLHNLIVNFQSLQDASHCSELILP